MAENDNPARKPSSLLISEAQKLAASTSGATAGLKLGFATTALDAGVLESLRTPTAAVALAESARRFEDLMRVSLGPASELQKTLDLVANHFAPRISSYARAVQQFERDFLLPKAEDLVRLGNGFQDYLLKMQDSFAKNQSFVDVVRLAGQIKTPWLDGLDPNLSFSGLAKLDGLSSALRSMPAFGDQLSETVRESLGDWRDPLSFDVRKMDDVFARSELYSDRGLDPSLARFPAASFDEVVDLVQLRPEVALVERYGAPVGPENNTEDEPGLIRTNEAHNILQRLERRLRQFIDRQMTKNCGTDWVKRRLPDRMLDEWRMREAAEKRVSGSVVVPLIAYADFTDYMKIILRKDNWREVFKPFFAREESIRESLQRLYPIRLATMHARIISQDDELYLFAEARRIDKSLPPT